MAREKGLLKGEAARVEKTSPAALFFEISCRQERFAVLVLDASMFGGQALKHEASFVVAAGRAGWSGVRDLPGNARLSAVASWPGGGGAGSGFSHGCHRLPNHLAIRLYSFILRHRRMHVGGDQPIGFARQFLLGDHVYELRLPSRGFAYYLEPPLPVQVIEGDIKGTRKRPMLGYVPKPGVRYPPGPPPPVHDTPDAKAGGGGES